MKRKIFISVNIPEKDRNRLIKAREKWQDLPIKWTKMPNLHFTVLFLGFVDEEVLPEICLKAREVAEKEDIFDLEFDKIGLFPSIDDPKTVALAGPHNEQLMVLHQNLEKAFGIFVSGKKSFRPHITLGRTRKNKWDVLEIKPAIAENYPLNLPVDSIDVMASDFGDGEQEYTVIESCPLK